MWNTPIGRLRAVALAEGVSFLVLLGVAMPLKYLGGMPAAVKVFGWAHGVLFVLLIAVLVPTARIMRWPLSRSAGVVMAALLPFGPFFIDRGLAREDEESGATFVSRPGRR